MGRGKVDADTLYGTLTLLVLQALTGGPLHGLAIARRIYDDSREGVEVGEGALYMALHRMARDGLVEASWGMSDTQRRAKFYTLTPDGTRRLEAETERWAAHVSAVASVLGLRQRYEP